jgi:hypothetical protein
MKVTYQAGWRRVTVTAITIEQAEMKARIELDRRCEKANVEPPVSWTLHLIKTETK